MSTFIVIAVIVLALFMLIKAIASMGNQGAAKAPSAPREKKIATEVSDGKERLFGPRPSAKAPKIKLLNREGTPWQDEYHTYIAGVNYRTSAKDVGGFSGYIANDAANTHDPNAMGIYTWAGKHIGFIPADQLDDYRHWCDAKPCPCAGYIYTEDGKMRGRVKALLPCNRDFIVQEFSRYEQWVLDNMGAEYVVSDMTFDIEED